MKKQLAGFAYQQPKGIVVCFLTEMWERFGFYVTQGLLILYMTGHLSLSDAYSGSILGTFSAFAYIAPIVGGYLADKILGYFHSVVLGGVFFIAGYGLLGCTTDTLFYYALAMIVVGNCFFKPNISTFLGTLYDVNDLRRERGFTIFYVGINVGSLLATVTSGYIVRYIGWGASFFASMFGLMIGLGVFIGGITYLQRRQQLVVFKKAALLHNHHLYVPLIYIGAAVAVYILAKLLQTLALGDAFLILSGILIAAMLVYCYARSTPQESMNLLRCVLLILIAIVFWGLYFQLFYSLNLFVDRMVNKELFGLTLPTPLFLGIQAFFVVVLGPLFAFIWQKLSINQRNPSAPAKFALALFITAAGFCSLWFSMTMLESGQLLPKGWIVWAYFLITVGELLLSPIGLSVITEWAPPSLAGMLMGVWFISLGFGSKLAGFLAQYAAIPATVTAHDAMVAIYAHAMGICTAVGVGGGLLMLVLKKILFKADVA